MIYAWVSKSLDLTTSAAFLQSLREKMKSDSNAESQQGKMGPHYDEAKYLKRGYAYKVADWHMN